MMKYIYIYNIYYFWKAAIGWDIHIPLYIQTHTYILYIYIYNVYILYVTYTLYAT